MSREFKEDYKLGDIFEACNYHPVFCTLVEEDERCVSGISLLDGTQSVSCSLDHCGVVPLTIEDVLHIRKIGLEKYIDEREAEEEAAFLPREKESNDE